MSEENLSVFTPKELFDTIHVYGRTATYKESLVLFWTASGFAVETSAGEVWAELESDFFLYEPWVSVWVDGSQVSRFMLQKGKAWYCLFRGFSKENVHRITLLKETQAMSADNLHACIVHHIGFPKGTDRSLLHKIQKKRLNIEFIGDSLTVGEGCLGPESAEEWRMVWISHMPAFPTLVSEAMQAEKRVVALGGWGASRSWDNQTDCRLGHIYGKLCAITPGGDVATPAPEKERPADAVVINLGTNDASALAKMEDAERTAAEADLRQKAAELMAMLRERYPQAAILWAYGLCGKQVEPILQAAVENRKQAGDSNVRYVSLPPAASNGSRMHPSRAAHRTAAAEIVQELKTMIR